ncbi:preprotein translocase subunit YajC [Anoxybacter fermentans]|uniref:Preprotein translocase subunit YajC n=1 Tax=Anoxybacter fermentans TaxID=1323375 RepID=A0A3S9SXP8_9FIRM|nr:preprotein translocase subunit YajC [Anoxybacter fermentans]AZR73107.1 preprotein translocase subunit YajC [Anoxybacter fermentans]
MATLLNLLPLIVVFVIFYFMLIRPQKKQQQKHQEMLNNLKIGDYVITIGGIKGVITKIRDNEVKLRVATGVEMEFLKSAVARLDPKHEKEEEEK